MLCQTYPTSTPTPDRGPHCPGNINPCPSFEATRAATARLTPPAVASNGTAPQPAGAAATLRLSEAPLPPQVTIDIDPALSGEQAQYLRAVIATAVAAAESEFGAGVPTFSFFGYVDQMAIAQKRAAWRGEPVDGSILRFSCEQCAEADYGVILARLGQGWDDHSLFPRRASILSGFPHELFHVLQIQALGRARNYVPVRGPAWLMEGSAHWWGNRVAAEAKGMPWEDVLRTLRARAAESPDKLSALEDPRDFAAAMHSYDIGLVATEFLLAGRSPALVLRYYGLIGAGSDWEVAFESVFGTPVAEFYAAFEQHMAGLR